MRLLSLLLLHTVVIGMIPPRFAFAEEIPVETGSLVIQVADSTESGSILLIKNNDSVPMEENNYELQNSSIESVTHSPLLVRISEVAWMGSDLSTADEWIEVTAIPMLTGSVMTESLNMRGWSISVRKDSGESVIAQVDHDLTIGSGQYLIFSNYSASQSRLSADPALISTAMSIPNTKLQLRLRDAAGVLIDEIDDYVGAPFAGANPSASLALPKATMERVDLRRTGTDASNWRTASTAMGFDADAPMLGTPGFAYPLPQSSSSSSSSSSQASIVPVAQPILSELLPDPPTNQEEWIELANTGSQLLDLSGWQLRSGSRTYTFTRGTVLASGERRIFPASVTGLQLPNSGGDVQLWMNGVMIDHILYTEMPDAVSIGRHEDGSVGPFCVPTPNAVNTVISPTISLTGFIRGLPNPTSINLEVKAVSGSLAGATCSIDYGDGFISNSCNPASHAMKRIGHVPIKTAVKDFCGNTMIQEDTLQIVGGSSLKNVSNVPKQNCTPTVSSGVTISEFLPAPAIGEDEWIELHNTTDETVSLCGWSVDDAIGGSHLYRLDDQFIEAGQFLLLTSKQTGIALNNDADTVRLIAPDMRGGTGVLLAIPYQDAESDIAFAGRLDGLMIQTPFPTPGSDNRFTAIDMTPGLSPVMISAAMPNPVGADTWDEWIELTNITGRPQWLNGWHIEDTAGHQLPLDGRVLAKREVQVIPLYKTSFTLTNAVGSIRLVDDQGAIRSVLAWHNAEDGHRVRISPDCTEQIYSGISVDDQLLIRARTLSGSTEILVIPGLVFDPLGDKNSDIKNYVSTLIKNKNIELKKCSDSSVSISVDGADIALLLLEQGLAIVDPVESGTRHDILMVYEDQAQKERRGVWRNMEDAVAIDHWKQARMRDSTVALDGLEITVSPNNSMLGTGSVITVSTNVPAELWVKEEGGAYKRFNGGVFVNSDTNLTFLAAYTYQTLSGGTVRTSVLSQSYSVKQKSYPPCIRINEVYPSPRKGEHEWVELKNICDHSVSLLGWTVDDTPEGGSKAFAIAKPVRINASGGSLLLSGSLLPISLNNGGDSVVLMSPDGRIQDVMSYLKTSAGRAIALAGDAYCQTVSPTPFMNNICIQSEIKIMRKKGKALIANMNAGLHTKYLAGLLQESEMNTKNDQFKGLIEGLNRNISKNNRVSYMHSVLAAFLFFIGILTFSSGLFLYMRKYRLWQ